MICKAKYKKRGGKEAKKSYTSDLNCRKRNRSDFHSDSSINFILISSNILLFYRDGSWIYSL